MLKNCKLYVIIDTGLIKGRDISKVAEDLLRAGGDIIQLRDKTSSDNVFLERAKAIKRIAKKHKRPFIINDRVDIARLVNADGVHLGQEDVSIEEARKILGKKIIGISTHSLNEAKTAEKKGADYIGIGPIFKTESKKDLLPIGCSVLNKIKKALDIPFFAIGGISLSNIKKVREGGAKRVAAISSLIKTKNVYQKTKELKKALIK